MGWCDGDVGWCDEDDVRCWDDDDAGFFDDVCGVESKLQALQKLLRLLVELPQLQGVCGDVTLVEVFFLFCPLVLSVLVVSEDSEEVLLLL